MSNDAFALPAEYARLLGPQKSAELSSVILSVIGTYIDERTFEIASDGFRTGLGCFCTPAQVEAALRMLLGTENQSDSEVAQSLRETRAALSKRHKRIRKHLNGFEALRCPQNVRKGAKPKGGAAPGLIDDLV